MRQPLDSEYKWAVVFRKLLIELTNLPSDRVLAKAQNSGYTTPNVFCAYNLDRADPAPSFYKEAGLLRAVYNLTFSVTIYGESALSICDNLRCGLDCQKTRDILQNEGMAYKSFAVIGRLIEFINDKPYQRCDVNIDLSAVIDRDGEPKLEKADIRPIHISF